jgi:hypothetical protein
MSKELAGVRADNKYSYRKLESIATNVRQALKLTPDQATHDYVRLKTDPDPLRAC